MVMSSLKMNRVGSSMAYARALHRAQEEGKRVFFGTEQRELWEYGNTTQ